MIFHDATVYLGSDYTLDAFQCSDVSSISRMLDGYGIERALLVALAAFRFELDYGNGQVFEAARRDDRLIPVPVVIPDSGGEVGDETAYVRRFVEEGARCAGFFPTSCNVSVDETVVGGLFAALERMRLPLLVPGAEADVVAIGRVARRYPDLPLIYGSPNYRNRDFLAVVRDCPNVHLTIGAPFAGNLAIEEICRRFGPERLLFSSNYPVSEPGAAIAYLMYSSVGSAELELIARGNMERLMRGVRHG